MATISIQMVIAHQKTRKRISAHLRQRGRKEPSTTEEITTAKGMVGQAQGEVAAEAQTSLCTTCITKMIQITEQKTA
jgi:hypothetical protein